MKEDEHLEKTEDICYAFLILWWKKSSNLRNEGKITISINGANVKDELCF